MDVRPLKISTYVDVHLPVQRWKSDVRPLKISTYVDRHASPKK